MRDRPSARPFWASMLVYAASRATPRVAGLPHAVATALLWSAYALLLVGIVCIARSPAVCNSRLRQWKLRLIGKAARQ